MTSIFYLCHIAFGVYSARLEVSRYPPVSLRLLLGKNRDVINARESFTK